MADAEFGRCEVCGKEEQLSRTYFDYGIKCECHNGNHAAFVRHCRSCTPKAPEFVRITLRSEDFKNLVLKSREADMLRERIECEEERNKKPRFPIVGY